MDLNKQKVKQLRIKMNNFCIQIPKTLESELSNIKYLVIFGEAHCKDAQILQHMSFEFFTPLPQHPLCYKRNNEC